LNWIRIPSDAAASSASVRAGGGASFRPAAAALANTKPAGPFARKFTRGAVNDAASDGILIQFKPGFDGAARAAVRGRVGGKLAEEILTAPMKAAGRGALQVVDLPAGASMTAALAAARANPAVAFAEPNWVLTRQATSNDPYYTNGSLWGMYGDATTPRNDFGSQAGEAWAAGNTGSNAVYVGVIDEGIDYTHPDLAANIWTNPFDPVDGVDNDGNGYVDDVRGWDFVNNDNSIFDKRDGDDHGTHVAGTIGARGGNAVGVAGVNWNVTLISAKFLGRNGGTLANAIKAVDYITDLKTRHGLNIVATNNSWGGGGNDPGLFAAIERANTANILFVAAAGNSGASGPSYPARYDVPNVIAVAAIASNGTLASFSNYGATTVDLGAPGVGVYSTLPNKKYGAYNGTSMAAPHVTGAAALYAATRPGLTAAQIKDAILGSVTPTASLNGKTITGGRLNVSGF
jgi:subtilisin family serine protease